MRDIDLYTLLLDYAPLLQSQPQAVTLYLFYYSLRDENNIVAVPYKAVTEHLGLSSTTIGKSIKLLRKIGLVASPQNGNGDGPTRHSGSIVILSPKPLANAERVALFQQDAKEINTKVRRSLLTANRLPLECQQLFSKKDLGRALKALGSENFTFREVAKYFKLDNDVIRLWASNPSFQQRFIACKKAVMQSSSNGVILKREKGKKKMRTPDDMYSGLMKAHLDRKTGEEIPKKNWKAIQLLRYFCILYEKVNGCKYTILSDSFSTKESRDMKTLLGAFRDDSLQAIRYLDWLFSHKNKALPDGILATGICLHPRMINEYRKRNTKNGHSRTDPIDNDFIQWIRDNTKELADGVKYMADLYWLKDEYDNEESSEEVKSIVEEGIRRGVIPKEGNIIFK